MLMTPVRHQSTAGIVALHSAALSLFSEYPSVVPKCSWNIQNSIFEAANPKLVFTEQGVARCAVHLNLPNTMLSPSLKALQPIKTAPAGHTIRESAKRTHRNEH